MIKVFLGFAFFFAGILAMGIIILYSGCDIVEQPAMITVTTTTTSTIPTKCYHSAYHQFLRHPGSVLVSGWKGDNQHAWVEFNGKVISGGGSDDLRAVLWCYYADEWLWIMGKWDAGQGVGAKDDDSGCWWVAEDGEEYPRNNRYGD